MKNKIIVLTLFAGLLAGFAFKTIATDNTASNTAISWVSQAVPKPDSDGWITLFDGEHLRGCNPTNDCFRSGKIFVQNGSLWVDSVDIPFNLKAREVAFRVQAKKVSGQNFGITFGRDVAWFNGGQAFGIGRVVNERYENLQGGKSAARFDDFFEMELLVTGGKILLVADGKTIVKAQDEESMDESVLKIGAFKGISMFKRIEVKLSGVQSMFPKDEAAAGAQPKPDAAERLKQVKALYDQGLINKEDYDKKVKEIMDSL
jgi:hypothetical protein